MWVVDETFAGRVSAALGRPITFTILNRELGGTLPTSLHGYFYHDGGSLKRWAHCSNPEKFTGKPRRNYGCECDRRGGQKHARNCQSWDWPLPPTWSILLAIDAGGGLVGLEGHLPEGAAQQLVDPPPTRKRPAQSTPHKVPRAVDDETQEEPRPIRDPEAVLSKAKLSRGRDFSRLIASLKTQVEKLSNEKAALTTSLDEARQASKASTRLTDVQRDLRLQGESRKVRVRELEGLRDQIAEETGNLADLRREAAETRESR